MKNLSQDGPSPDRDLIPGSQEYKANTDFQFADQGDVNASRDF